MAADRRSFGFLNSLSGRFLALTVVFVMLAEVLIFVPSIARFRADTGSGKPLFQDAHSLAGSPAGRGGTG